VLGQIGGVEGARRALVLGLRAADFEWMWPKCDTLPSATGAKLNLSQNAS